ncbi:hypothetical protein SUNI508_01108 [Seiridium unicorne]|uniref:Uncharacterized protein n=1 Tax=Seiridium unicorne TaxID=138068 RepID=A0ABR2UX27_9PEZI
MQRWCWRDPASAQLGLVLVSYSPSRAVDRPRDDQLACCRPSHELRRSDGRCNTNSGTSEMSSELPPAGGRNGSNDAGIKSPRSSRLLRCDPQLDALRGEIPAKRWVRYDLVLLPQSRPVAKVVFTVDSQPSRWLIGNDEACAGTTAGNDQLKLRRVFPRVLGILGGGVWHSYIYLGSVCRVVVRCRRGSCMKETALLPDLAQSPVRKCIR